MAVSLGPALQTDWLAPLGEPVAAVSWSPHSEQLAVLTTEGKLAILEASGGRIVHEIAGHVGGGFRVAYHPKENLVASSGADGIAKFWDPATGAMVNQFAAGSAWVEQLEWSPNGETLAVAAGRVLTLWNSKGGAQHRLKDHASTISGLCWRTDSQVLAVACYGGVHLYEPISGRLIEKLPWKTSLVSLAWSPDQRWVVAGTQDLSVQIWPLPFQAGAELAMSGYPGKVRELAWHYSGKYLATGGGEEVMVWDCSGEGPAGTTPRILPGHAARITALAYQARGHWLASAGWDGKVLFYNVKRPTPLGEASFTAPVTALAWSPNDAALVVGCQNGSVGLVRPPG